MSRPTHPVRCYLAPDDAPAKRILTEALRLFPIDFLVMGWLGVLQQFARAGFFGSLASPARRQGNRLEQVLSRMTAR